MEKDIVRPIIRIVEVDLEDFDGDDEEIEAAYEAQHARDLQKLAKWNAMSRPA